eukprot:scaffold34478_cov22-Cyclotella_meneghiniana.AAC.2
MEGVLIQATEFQYCNVYRQHCCSSVKRKHHRSNCNAQSSSEPILQWQAGSSWRYCCKCAAAPIAGMTARTRSNLTLLIATGQVLNQASLYECRSHEINRIGCNDGSRK